MTDTRRELILSAITITVGAISALTGKVYRSRPDAFARLETPVVNIKPLRDTSNATNIPFLNWTLQVAITLMVRGAVPDTIADPYVASITAALMADRTLGGLCFDILPVDTYFEMQEGDKPMCAVNMIFEVTYRTQVGDLTT